MSDSQPVFIRLLPPEGKGNLTLEEAITRRRSVRRFSAEPLSLPQLSHLMWAAQGVTPSSRTVPSAGATYPMEIFIACGEETVTGLGGGIYHYLPDSHSLGRHHDGDVRPELAAAALDQGFIHRAPLDIIICVLYERTTRRYGNRGERYVHFEVGHAGQNIYLEATALGLGTVAVGAFGDEEVREVLRLGPKYHPLYIMPVGKPV